MIDWGRSYSAEWRVYRVNRQTWADSEIVDNVDSLSLSRTADGSLLESGTINVTGDFDPDYYRIVMIATQGGEIERVNVTTLLFDLSDGDSNYGVTTSSFDGFSVLYPAAVKAITIGEYTPAGSDGAIYARDLLRTAINAPIEIEGSFTVNDNIVHELGSSVLDCVWNILNAGNFILQVDGYGTVHIMPMPTQPSLVINNSNANMLENEIRNTYDMSEIPNRYVVIDEDIVTVAVNDDPNSPISTVSRGYNVDIIDTTPTLVNGETYSEYANRMLHKASILKEEKTYLREYAPDVYPYSIVRASLIELNGDLRVQSQSINCDNGITVSERSFKETNLW